MLKPSHSVGDEKTYTIVVVIVILIAYIAHAVSLFTWCRGYYTYKDAFDPSPNRVAMGMGIVLFLLASFLYFLHFSSSRRSNGGGNSILPIINNCF